MLRVRGGLKCVGIMLCRVLYMVMVLVWVILVCVSKCFCNGLFSYGEVFFNSMVCIIFGKMFVDNGGVYYVLLSLISNVLCLFLVNVLLVLKNMVLNVFLCLVVCYVVL